jgi:D-amino peptidase
MMMQGIDSTFDAAIFIGYHSATTNLKGVRAHTISSARLTSVELNGLPMAESGINAAIAGHFGVPIVMISGDDAAVNEARALLGDVEGAIVKTAISFHSALTMTPEAGQKLIRERARTALQRRGAFKPYVLRSPVRLDITFKNYRVAEMLAYLPIVERPTAHSIRYTGRTILDISKFIEFVTSYSIEIDP